MKENIKKTLEKSHLVKELLGEYTFKRYQETKRQEWNSFRTWVTDWEIKRYLPNS